MQIIFKVVNENVSRAECVFSAFFWLVHCSFPHIRLVFCYLIFAIVVVMRRISTVTETMGVLFFNYKQTN